MVPHHLKQMGNRTNASRDCASPSATRPLRYRGRYEPELCRVVSEKFLHQKLQSTIISR